MRKCHLNTCPVGIATQREELREMFAGRVEDLINFFTFMAEDLREHMAMLGYRTVEEMVGQGQHLLPDVEHIHSKAASLDLNPIAGWFPLEGEKEPLPFQWSEFEEMLLTAATPALTDQQMVQIHSRIKNTDRSVGSRLSYEISKRYGGVGLPSDTINIHLEGVAGQSFGAFAARGLSFYLAGEVNDYLGKGLSGANLVISPPDSSRGKKAEVIAGNVALYGATSGSLFLGGIAGERFAVRNSGATAVVEGIGDHGCEYMTGGKVVILGEVGKNFAAGMSGGVAFIYDPTQQFKTRIGSTSVDLDPLDQEDMVSLRELLEKHAELTGSLIAAEILDTWQARTSDFIKVIPQEYKKILNSRKGQFPPTSLKIG